MKQVSSLLHLAALSYSFSVAASSDDFPHVRRGLRSKPDVSFAGMVAEYAQNIVGGTAANGTEVPWFVHFGDGSCGGSLISENRVLTAAHCVYSVGAPESVRIGATTPSNGRSVAVTCAKVHPDYDGDVGNDVAILKLSESVTDVPFISLNSDTAYPSTSGQRLTVIGMSLVVTGNAQDNAHLCSSL